MISMVVIEAQKLSKVYPGGHEALRDVTVTIRKGEVVGILGHSGAGKTTFFRLLNGALRPTTGSLIVLGQPMDQISVKGLQRLRRRMAFVYQHPHLVPTLSVAHNVLIGGIGNYSLLQTLRSLITLLPQERERVFTALEQLGMADKMYRRANELSGGEQQRVAVARALISCPELLLADEPIASVDVRTATVVLEALKKLNASQGTTILLNLHQVDFALRYCSRLLVLSQGRLVYDGLPEGITDMNVYGENRCYA